MRLKTAALIVTLALGILLAPLAADAQQGKKIWQIGVLSYGALGSDWPFRNELRRLGYVEGQNIAIQVRTAEGRSERLPGLATDLVRLRVDLIVAIGTAATRAATDATATIPIVMAPADDPVHAGFIASLARPGGNVTGVSVMSWETGGKQLQLLKEVAPQLTRIGVLWNPANPGHQRAAKELEAPARSVGAELHLAAVREPEELDRAFSGMVKAHAGAVIVLGDSMLYAERRRIVDLAARSRLPAIYFRREFVERGGLMSYATDVADLSRRAATYVDKILKGTKPSDLPVEQPMKFELVVNRKTAKALSLTIPQSVLLRADEVIQ